MEGGRPGGPRGGELGEEAGGQEAAQLVVGFARTSWDAPNVVTS